MKCIMFKIVTIDADDTPQIMSIIITNRIRNIANSIFKILVKLHSRPLCCKFYALVFAIFEDKAETLKFACREIACCYRAGGRGVGIY
jgi:hypothetical protein